MLTLGQHLRGLRDKQGMTLRQLAARVRITAPYLSDIELGRRHPSDRVLADLAKALHTPADDLRRHDPRTLLHEIEERIRGDADYAHALRRVLSRCATAADLLRFVD